VGGVGGIPLSTIRRGRLTTALFNAAQILLASAAAAIAFEVVGGSAGDRLAIGAVAAALAYAAVNVGLVIPGVVLETELSPRQVWADMRPTFPSYMAFGLFGILVGWLERSLGIVAIPLLLVPVTIARAVFASYLELHASHEAAVRTLVRAIEAKDRYTAGHSARVARYAEYIGVELGCSPSRLEHLRYAALMHDIGKLVVPSDLLNKPGRLTEEEYEAVRAHNEVCVSILNRVEFLHAVLPVATDQHASYEPGSGDDFSVMEGYIVAVADAFDAMTSTRSYRQALAQDVAFDELRAHAGTQFHPGCVDALITAIERRGEHHGHGHESEVAWFPVPPPVAGVGSAGLGDVLSAPEWPPA
jgi:hypothetical protein